MRLRYVDKKVGLRMIKPFIYFTIWAIDPKEVMGNKNKDLTACHLLECIHQEFSKVGDQNEKPPYYFNFCKARLINWRT